MSDGTLTKSSAAKQALENLKMEVAEEVGIPLQSYNGDMSVRDAGRIGGNMVRRLIRLAEEQLDR